MLLGDLEIDTCPLEFIGPDVYEFMDLARRMEEGIPPVAGGTLDQSESFLQAYATYRNYSALCEEKRRKPHAK